jgi:antirestriction protein ArdC
MQNTERQDVYTRITGRIIQSLEQGVRPWTKPWSAENATGRIIRPLRHNGQAYSGINVLMLWSAAVGRGIDATLTYPLPFQTHGAKVTA